MTKGTNELFNAAKRDGDMTHIMSYVHNGERFEIYKVQAGSWVPAGYYAFNARDIKDGVLAKSYNGIGACHSEDLAETLTYLVSACLFRDYRKDGATALEKFEAAARATTEAIDIVEDLIEEVQRA